MAIEDALKIQENDLRPIEDDLREIRESEYVSFLIKRRNQN